MILVLDGISVPGYHDRPNEDACGTAGDWAWVIDTSIFPGTPAILHPHSDAAWFARFASERFEVLAPQAEDGVVLAAQVMQEVRDAFLAVAPEERRDFVTWPVGAITLVRAQEERLDVWWLADTTAFVRQPDGTVLTVGDGPELRCFETAKAAELLRLSGCTPKDITGAPAFRAWLAERRRRQRASGGVALFGLKPEHARQMQHRTLAAPPGTIVLLTSDGFSALVDLYGEFDAAGLMTAALDTGLEPLVRTARRIETEIDPSGARFPRFKTSDDATGLLLKI